MCRVKYKKLVPAFRLQTRRNTGAVMQRGLHRDIDLGCLPFVRMNRLGQALNNGKGFSKISKPTEQNGPCQLQFDFL